MPSLPLRALIAGLALAGAVGGARWWSDDRACTAARQRIEVVVFSGFAVPEREAARFRDRCRYPARVAAFAVDVAHADAGAAAGLAASARQRAPRTFAPWAALAIIEAGHDPEAARAAWRRARALNPRWPMPRP